MHRTKTKIIITMGPALQDLSVLKKVLTTGVDCIRINTAHGDFKNYAAYIRDVRKVADVAVMIDIKGPEIRLRAKKEMTLAQGSILFIRGKKNHDVHFSYDIIPYLKGNETLYFDNGFIKGKVVKKKKDGVLVRFFHDCVLKPNKGVNIPGTMIPLPSLSSKDKEAIKFAERQHAAYIALSFTRHANDVIALRKMIPESIGIIAKIENHEGIRNIDEIIKASEGVMVARGDLGIEIRQEKIPFLQKLIISKCNQAGKISIVATQMLESMINSPLPTRAEVSDAAHAILDGADALMLSGETAVGKHPMLAVKTLHHLAKEIENKVQNRVMMDTHATIGEELSKSAYSLALRSEASVVVCATRSGYTAMMMSRYRLHKPIVAVTPSLFVKRRLQLVWGVFPTLMFPFPRTSVAHSLIHFLMKHKILGKKDVVVMIGGFLTRKPHISNRIELHDLKDVVRFSR